MFLTLQQVELHVETTCYCEFVGNNSIIERKNFRRVHEQSGNRTNIFRWPKYRPWSCRLGLGTRCLGNAKFEIFFFLLLRVQEWHSILQKDFDPSVYVSKSLTRLRVRWELKRSSRLRKRETWILIFIQGLKTMWTC